jgi:hypothetical protein
VSTTLALRWPLFSENAHNLQHGGSVWQAAVKAGVGSNPHRGHGGLQHRNTPAGPYTARQAFNQGTNKAFPSFGPCPCTCSRPPSSSSTYLLLMSVCTMTGRLPQMCTTAGERLSVRDGNWSWRRALRGNSGVGSSVAAIDRARGSECSPPRVQTEHLAACAVRGALPSRTTYVPHTDQRRPIFRQRICSVAASNEAPRRGQRQDITKRTTRRRPPPTKQSLSWVSALDYPTLLPRCARLQESSPSLVSDYLSEQSYGEGLRPRLVKQEVL